MTIKTLLRANLRTHRGAALGVLALLLLLALCVCTVLSVWLNAGQYVSREMARLGYGALTVWVSGLEDAAPLAQEMEALPEVASVGVQRLIFSEYEVGDQESDSEGQLIAYDPQAYPYKFFADDLSGYRDAPQAVEPGEVYVCASMVSMFGVGVGDAITFPIARSGGDVTLTVAGFYEDPFMGSSMIGMKGFLIGEADRAAIAAMAQEAGNNALARPGFMLHVHPSGEMTAAALGALLNSSTSLAPYTAFTHSREAILGFMLTLQNVFTALLMAFALVLLLACAAVLAHSIASAIEQDFAAMGILKTVGMTSGRLRAVQLLQVALPAALGMGLGLGLAVPAARLVCRMTVTTTGLLVPAALPAFPCLAALAAMLLPLMGFIWLRTAPIRRIAPVAAIRGTWRQTAQGRSALPLHRRGLALWLALRQIASGRRRYVGACAVAALLVCFASLIGRVNDWLGPNGEGLMDAFNPADLHIAAQPMGNATLEDVEAVIARYTSITDAYDLAMPSVSVAGVDMTANVITEPERFHMLAGETCLAADEIVLTEFVAADLGVSIGDTVRVAGALGGGEFVVSGIYQCANDMGMNVGLSREGYARVGRDAPNMWCRHYFLADPACHPQIMQALETTFGGDVYLHENAWPGLTGILAAMQMMMVFLYGMVLLFVLVATLLTAQKLLRAEQKDLMIQRVIGLSAGRLRRAFALRFALVSLLGSALGTALSALITDPLVAQLMRMEGISNFASHPGALTILLPGAVVTAMFALFAYAASGAIGKGEASMLARE